MAMPSDPDFDPGFERRPRRATASGGPSPVKILVIVFGILGLLGCLSCGGLIGYAVYLSQPTWTPYASPDGSFAAQFPKPNPTTAAGTGPDARPYTSVETPYGFPPSKFFVRTTVVTPAEARSPEALYNAVADSWAKDGTRTSETSRDPGTHKGGKCLDLVLSRGSDKVITLRFILVGTKLFTVGVDSDLFDETDPPVIEFLDGFQPNATPREKK
jgi:hypothetical protein